MTSDTSRYNRSDKCTDLTLAEAQTIISKVITGIVSKISHLEGGFHNTNYKLEFEDTTMASVVLRISHQSSMQFNIETQVSLRFEDTHAPKFLGKTIWKGKNAAVFSFHSGILLEKELITKPQSTGLADSLGRTLANIHSHSFEYSGFFNERLEVEYRIENVGEDLVEFALQNFRSSVAKEKMGDDLQQDILSLLKAFRVRMAKISPTNCLVHYDFNPKNILVENGEVKAILDWEYAAVGSPLVDLANFFRFKDDYSLEFQDAFMAAYTKSCNYQLPNDWESLIKVVDLASMSSFITRSKVLDNNSKTAIRICRETVQFHDRF